MEVDLLSVELAEVHSNQMRNSVHRVAPRFEPGDLRDLIQKRDRNKQTPLTFKLNPPATKRMNSTLVPERKNVPQKARKRKEKEGEKMKSASASVEMKLTSDGRPVLKVAVLGDFRCGKTSLAERFCDDTFFEFRTFPGDRDFWLCSVELDDGRRAKLMVWDTAGVERFRVLTAVTLKGAAAVMLVFRFDVRETFEGATQKWLEEARERIDDPRLPLFLVGHSMAPSRLDVVTEKEAIDFVRSAGLAGFFRVNAKIDEGVTDAFMAAAEAAWNFVVPPDTHRRRRQAFALAQGIHPRIGSGSPVSLICPFVIHSISELIPLEPIRLAQPSVPSTIDDPVRQLWFWWWPCSVQ